MLNSTEQLKRDIEDLKKDTMALKFALVASVIAGAICVTILFAHVYHDTMAFQEMERAIKEYHR